MSASSKGIVANATTSWYKFLLKTHFVFNAFRTSLWNVAPALAATTVSLHAWCSYRLMNANVLKNFSI